MRIMMVPSRMAAVDEASGMFKLLLLHPPQACLPDMRFLELKKNLKKDYSSHKKLNVALLADTSTQLLAQAIRGYGYERGFDLHILETPHGDIGRQIEDRFSELYAFHPDIVLLFQASQKLMDAFYRLDAPERSLFSNQRVQRVSAWVSALNTHLAPRAIIHANFNEIDDSVFGNFSNKTDRSFLSQLRSLNIGLMELARRVDNLFINDISTLQNRYGMRFVIDPRLYGDADMAFSVDFLPVLAKNVLDIISAASGVFAKCLILDLDNTLWGGTIGDDGMEHIQIGNLGQGKVFSELQQWAKELKERGILLAICSNNDARIAREPFERHPDMVLALDDIAVFVANWESKVANIRRIRSFLNIGYDSMVLIDDSAFERNLVRKYLPDITVPELPDDPEDHLPYLRSLNLFETSSFTEGDEHRTRRLQEEAKREAVRQVAASETEYLQELGMICTVRRFDDFTIPRIAQLTQRSNQFNVRTVRYSEEDIRRIAADRRCVHFSFSLKDKYGDYGLIGAVILRPKEEALFIDTWIMSCRVLKRGVETLIMNTIADAARKHGYAHVLGEYLPTAKNALVKDLFPGMGFRRTGNGLWELAVADYRVLSHVIREERVNG